MPTQKDSKEQTALQQLIDYATIRRNNSRTLSLPADEYAMDAIILKATELLEVEKRQIRAEAIGYNLWVDSLSKSGYPRNENGTMMNCWELYDYFLESDKRNTYIQHGSKYTNQ